MDIFCADVPKKIKSVLKKILETQKMPSIEISGVPRRTLQTFFRYSQILPATAHPGFPGRSKKTKASIARLPFATRIPISATTIQQYLKVI
jgi:hypothetical protein